MCSAAIPTAVLFVKDSKVNLEYTPLVFVYLKPLSE